MCIRDSIYTLCTDDDHSPAQIIAQMLLFCSDMPACQVYLIPNNVKQVFLAVFDQLQSVDSKITWFMCIFNLDVVLAGEHTVLKHRIALARGGH